MSFTVAVIIWHSQQQHLRIPIFLPPCQYLFSIKNFFNLILKHYNCPIGVKWYPKESVFKEFLAVASAAPFPMLQPGCIHRVSPTICTAFAQAVPTASLLGYSPLIIGLKP